MVNKPWTAEEMYTKLMAGEQPPCPKCERIRERVSRLLRESQIAVLEGMLPYRWHVKQDGLDAEFVPASIVRERIKKLREGP